MSSHLYYEGPWTCRKRSAIKGVIGEHWVIEMKDHPNAMIAIVISGAYVSAEANLIAAAPDLLAALENIRDTIESCYVAGGWVSLDAEEMESIATLACAAIATEKGVQP